MMPLAIGTFLPSVIDEAEWITDSIGLSDIIGSPLVMQFWAISCPICKMNFPKLQELLTNYHMHNLKLISVHMPRIESDTNLERVKAAITELELPGPCAIDNNHVIGDRFQTGGAWPSYFLFDAEGKLRSRASGVLGIKMAENSLRRLLELETP